MNERKRVAIVCVHPRPRMTRIGLITMHSTAIVGSIDGATPYIRKSVYDVSMIQDVVNDKRISSHK